MLNQIRDRAAAALGAGMPVPDRACLHPARPQLDRVSDSAYSSPDVTSPARLRRLDALISFSRRAATILAAYVRNSPRC